MEQTRDNNNNRRHYSEKGGHFYRGCYDKLRKNLESVFPEIYMREISLNGTLEASRRIKRQMFRNPRDGRR